MQEAKLEQTPQGTKPTSEGWFVLNAKDCQWYGNPKFGACTDLEGAARFSQVGVNLHMLYPGQPNCFYHKESQQENFLVLAGECRLVIEGQERLLKAWDFVHCPPETEHVFVGAGEGICLILMLGARGPGETVTYPVSPVAAQYGGSAAIETSQPKEAYAGTPKWEVLPQMPQELLSKMHP